MNWQDDQTELRILLLEDVPTDAELVEEELREAGLSFTTKRVDTREEFTRALEEFKPDIVLADYHLPAFDGGSAVKIVRQQYPTVPVLMVTGAVGDETAVELLKLGARDYILKDRLARLGPAVRRALSEEQGERARKAAAEALRQSESDLRTIVEHSPIAMLVDTGVDVDEKIVMMNRKFTGLFGYTMADVPDVHHWWLLAYPDEQYREKIKTEWTRQVEEAIQSHGYIEPMEATVTCKDGSSRYVRVSLASIGSRNIITFEDLTERKQAEEQIRFSEALLRQTQSLAAIGSWRLYVPRNELIWSDETYRMFGIPVGTPLGYEVFIDHIHPDDRAMVDSAWQAALKGAPYCVQHRIVVNGATRWVEERAELEFDAQGNLQSGMGAVQEITERKQAEMRIQKLTRLYATLSQTNGIIVRATNRQELLCSICKTAVTHGKFVMAWWGLVDESTRMVKPLCHHGAENGYLTDIAVSADDVPTGRGPTGTAIRENRVSYVNDYTSDERVLPRREAALKSGFRGAAGVPLRFRGKVIGALTLYTDEPDFFDAEQMSLLEEMAADIAFALEGFEREAQRRQAEGERETALMKLRKALEDSIQVAASISEARDPYTAGHQQRVGQLAEAIAVEMGLPQAQAEGIRFGSLIHDIGKIGVPAEILSKPSKLTPLELQLIQTHPRAGYEIIKDIEFPWPVAQMILQHHERLNGAGYPAGLKGDDILLEARIIAVADTIEAMSSHRPYRPGLGMEAALAEIAGASGTFYDRQAVEACTRLIREKGFTFKAG